MTELERNIAHAQVNTMLGAVEEANQLAGINNFRFAPMDEWKKFMQTFTEGDYPAHISEPWETKLVWLNGRIKTTMPLSGWVLCRVPIERSEWRSREVEDLYLAPMRNLCKSFFRHLLDATIINQEEDQVDIEIMPEYGFLSENLFGVSYKASIRVIELEQTL